MTMNRLFHFFGISGSLACAFFVTFLSLPAQAEYRAFQLLISNSKTGKTRLVTSNLDDIQYPGYYPLLRDETIVIQSTWMCYGSTGNFKPICPNPNPDGGAAKASQ